MEGNLREYGNSEASSENGTEASDRMEIRAGPRQTSRVIQETFQKMVVIYW